MHEHLDIPDSLWWSGLMFIGRVTHRDRKNSRTYHTFKLLESVRTERGPRRRTVLNLGADFNLPEEHWKDLANRIEGIVTSQQPLFTYGQEVVGNWGRS